MATAVVVARNFVVFFAFMGFLVVCDFDFAVSVAAFVEGRFVFVLDAAVLVVFVFVLVPALLVAVLVFLFGLGIAVFDFVFPVVLLDASLSIPSVAIFCL